MLAEFPRSDVDDIDTDTFVSTWGSGPFTPLLCFEGPDQ